MNKSITRQKETIMSKEYANKAKGQSLNLLACALCCCVLYSVLSACSQNGSVTTPIPPKDRVDVNDIAFMFPVPSRSADLADLISVADLRSSKDNMPIFPESDFRKLVELSESSVSVVGSRRIKFKESAKVYSAWKIAGLRYDPIATIPQVRLIVQPVEEENGSVTVLEETFHLVFMFPPGIPTDVKPEDNPLLRTALDDLIKVRQFCYDAGVVTRGQLDVHPCLEKKVKGFSKQITQFLESNLHVSQMNAGAIMGLHDGGPEPWILIAYFRGQDGNFSALPSPGLGGESDPPRMAQMLSFLPGDKTLEPAITNTNRSTGPDRRLGVSIEDLFEANPRLDDFATIGVDENGKKILDTEIRNRDIPDFIANPKFAEFFNTDCITCHSEATRRAILKLPESKFAYKQPEGISGFDPKDSPDDRRNLRQFGWFHTEISITPRTSNESSEMAKYINEHFFNKS